MGRTGGEEVERARERERKAVLGASAPFLYIAASNSNSEN